MCDVIGKSWWHPECGVSGLFHWVFVVLKGEGANLVFLPKTDH